MPFDKKEIILIDNGLMPLDAKQWILLFQEFDFIIKGKKGVKNIAVDHLSRGITFKQ